MFIFLILSPLYYYVQLALLNEASALNLERLISFCINENFLIGIFCLSLVLVWRVKKWSTKVLAFSFFYLSGKMVWSVYQEYDKVVLLMAFSYAVFSYFFYLFWKEELSAAVYNPGYTSADLLSTMNYKIKASVSDDEGKSKEGFLTNWNEDGCFIKFLSPADVPRSKHLTVKFEFHDQVFHQQGLVIVREARGGGVGLRFGKEAGADDLSWNQLYNILHNHSLTPEYLC